MLVRSVLQSVSIVSLLFTLAGCATTPSDSFDETAYDEATQDESTTRNVDPLEGLNRVTFKANDALDRWVAKPLAIGYKAVAPQFVEVGVSNFFDNLGELSSAVNNLLQGKPAAAGRDTARFTLNTFAGLAGLFDVATPAGLEKNHHEDFGQTLQVWGVPKGPYIVLPILGPSTLTDALGRPVDYFMTPTSYIEHDETLLGVTVVDLIDTRASLLGADDLVSGDRYLFFREAYLQNREFVVKDGEIEDDFGGDLDDF